MPDEPVLVQQIKNSLQESQQSFWPCYIMYVKSVFKYASPAWKSAPEKHVKKLEKVLKYATMLVLELIDMSQEERLGTEPSIGEHKDQERHDNNIQNTQRN